MGKTCELARMARLRRRGAQIVQHAMQDDLPASRREPGRSRTRKAKRDRRIAGNAARVAWHEGADRCFAAASKYARRMGAELHRAEPPPARQGSNRRTNTRRRPTESRSRLGSLVGSPVAGRTPSMVASCGKRLDLNAAVPLIRRHAPFHPNNGPTNLSYKAIIHPCFAPNERKGTH